LGVLAFYAGASVGLSALSSVAAGAYGGASSWAVAATFIEESGEALAGVAFLMAVLAGVAPALVLPREWALRRSADAATIELSDRLPGPAVPGETRRLRTEGAGQRGTAVRASSANSSALDASESLRR